MKKSFFKRIKGATMIEYAIMLGLIAGVCIGAVTVIGTKTEGLFQSNSHARPHRSPGKRNSPPTIPRRPQYALSLTQTLALGATILTRDPRFYRTYFPSVRLISPETEDQ